MNTDAELAERNIDVLYRTSQPPQRLSVSREHYLWLAFRALLAEPLAGALKPFAAVEERADYAVGAVTGAEINMARKRIEEFENINAMNPDDPSGYDRQ